MTLNKMGEPYTPMSEAEKRAMRNRPYPSDFGRTSQMLTARDAQRAKEPERVYKERPEDVRAEPASMAKAIQRKVKRGK